MMLKSQYSFCQKHDPLDSNKSQSVELIYPKEAVSCIPFLTTNNYHIVLKQEKMHSI